MSWLSVLLGLLGGLALLATGYFFNASRATPQKGEQPKGEQKKKPFPYNKALLIASGVAGPILFLGSYYFFYWHFAGKIITPGWLNPKLIYRVGGQSKIEEQNAVFVGNAGKDVWCIDSEPIDPQAKFVKAEKSPADGKWRLKPLDVLPKTPKE